MVGPLSTEEIEDVVSSVRRLVSNEQRPRNLSRDLNADRLLLTPALRVVPDMSPLSPLLLEAPVDEPGPVAEEPISTAPEPPPAEPMDDGDVVLVEAEWEDEIWSDPEPPLAEVALGAEEAEILIAAGEEPEAPFAAEVDEQPEPWAQLEPGWVEDEPIPFIPLRRRAENLAAKLAAGTPVETTTQPPEFEAHVVEISTAAEPVVEPTSAEGELGSQAPDPEVAEEQAPERTVTEILDADGNPIAVLDEAALQEIVRLMIRKELQGEMGERITRNIRKLVRAEINRALVARDLD